MPLSFTAVVYRANIPRRTTQEMSSYLAQNQSTLQAARYDLLDLLPAYPGCQATILESLDMDTVDSMLGDRESRLTVTEFDFDLELINTRTYKRTLARLQAASKRKGRRPDILTGSPSSSISEVEGHLTSLASIKEELGDLIDLSYEPQTTTLSADELKPHPDLEGLIFGSPIEPTDAQRGKDPAGSQERVNPVSSRPHDEAHDGEPPRLKSPAKPEDQGSHASHSQAKTDDDPLSRAVEISAQVPTVRHVSSWRHVSTDSEVAHPMLRGPLINRQDKDRDISHTKEQKRELTSTGSISSRPSSPLSPEEGDDIAEMKGKTTLEELAERIMKRPGSIFLRPRKRSSPLLEMPNPKRYSTGSPLISDAMTMALARSSWNQPGEGENLRGDSSDDKAAREWTTLLRELRRKDEPSTKQETPKRLLLGTARVMEIEVRWSRVIEREWLTEMAGSGPRSRVIGEQLRRQIMNDALKWQTPHVKGRIQEPGDDLIFPGSENKRPYPGTGSIQGASQVDTLAEAVIKLRGFGAKETSDLSRIEDMLVRLLGDVDVPKTQITSPPTTSEPSNPLQRYGNAGSGAEGIKARRDEEQDGCSEDGSPAHKIAPVRPRRDIEHFSWPGIPPQEILSERLMAPTDSGISSGRRLFHLFHRRDRLQRLRQEQVTIEATDGGVVTAG